MTENKRFKLRLSKLGNGMITDTQKRKHLYFDKKFLDATLPKTYELLNELAEENEQLKQFKENVFYKIDMHLRMLPTARDNEFNEENGDPSLYTGAIYMLETLKKELKE